MNASKRRQPILAAFAISISTILTLIALELMLHVAARIFPIVEAVLFSPQFFDRPPVAEHLDANGFRNTTVPDTADIVAIGDSHTYGPSVFDEAWPRVLEKLTSCRVYSMALGGYGPLQYAIWAKRALRFKPRLMLVGIYFGNDFFENWAMYLRNPSKYPVPKELINNALESERRNPLSPEVMEFFLMGQPEAASPLRSFLAQNSALWGFARAIKNKLFVPQNNAPGSGTGVLSGEFRTAVAALTPKQLEYASVFEGPDWKTILTSRYREAVENADDPRIGVGIWLTKWAIEHIDQLAKQNSIKTMFILLPTKESVFVDKVKVADDHRYFKKLTAEEDQHRQDLIEYMKKNDLTYIDMTPSLRSMVEQPYFENADGHPNAIGHKEIATRLLEQVGICKH